MTVAREEEFRGDSTRYYNILLLDILLPRSTYDSGKFESTYTLFVQFLLLCLHLSISLVTFLLLIIISMSHFIKIRESNNPHKKVFPHFEF